MKKIKVQKIINLTPHKINLLVGDKELVLKPAQNPARVQVENTQVGEVQFEGMRIPLNGFKVKGVTKYLPKKKEGVIYVVSMMVTRANPDRDDLFIVDELVRDKEGNIIGAKALSQNPYYKKSDTTGIKFSKSGEIFYELKRGKGYFGIKDKNGKGLKVRLPYDVVFALKRALESLSLHTKNNGNNTEK